MKTKTCSRCKQALELSAFAMDRSKKDGKVHACRECDADRRARQKGRPRNPKRVAGAGWLGKIRVDETTGCWLWLGSRVTYGYGNAATPPGRTTLVHRFLLEETIGRVLGPEEYACHTCDVPSCVNPDHLYAGNARTNRQDCCDRDRANLSNSRKTHCPKGHSYEDAYTRSNGSRQCKPCSSEAAKTPEARARAAELARKRRALRRLEAL